MNKHTEGSLEELLNQFNIRNKKYYISYNIKLTNKIHKDSVDAFFNKLESEEGDILKHIDALMQELIFDYMFHLYLLKNKRISIFSIIHTLTDWADFLLEDGKFLDKAYEKFYLNKLKEDTWNKFGLPFDVEKNLSHISVGIIGTLIGNIQKIEYYISGEESKNIVNNTKERAFG